MELLYIIIFNLIITFLIINFLKTGFIKKLIDIPNKRSSHTKATISGGGLSFVLSLIIICLINKVYFPLILLPLALIGFLDDIFKLSARIRYSIQLLTAFAILSNSSLYLKTFKEFGLNHLLFTFILIISITAIINFINFMDGLDMLIGNSFFIFLFLYSTFYDIFFLPVTASLLVFLFYNKPPAKIFMGDIGSTFLGSLFCLIVLRSVSWNQAIGFVFILSPLFMDTILTRFLIYINGHNFFAPHKFHLYQRLYQSGYSKLNINFIYCLPILLNFIVFRYLGLSILFFIISLELSLGFYLDRKIVIKVPNLKA